MEKLALYIHWPWCLKKCPYCDFNSHVAQKDDSDQYVDALIADMQNQAKLISPRELVSIFFGGGTPSLMHPEQVKRILQASQAVFKWSDDIEITLESNPTSSNFDKFQLFKEAGINRLSIGVQSLHDDDLSFLGREHSAKDAQQTVQYANSIFNNVNVDFIYGLPKQDLQVWINDLHTICELGTTHVSAYQLTIEPNTKFFGEVRKNKWRPLDDDAQADFFIETEKTLKSHNIMRYETSNYSKDMTHCKHNYHIWEYNDYMGIGAGAHGRLEFIDKSINETRQYRMPNTYISSVEHVEHGYYICTSIDKTRQSYEKLITGIRLVNGVQISNEDMKIINKQALKKLISNDLIHFSNETLSLTSKGTLLTDSILSDLIL